MVESHAVGVEPVPRWCHRAEAERLAAERERTPAVGPPRVVVDDPVVDLVAEVAAGWHAEQLLVEGLAAVDVGDGQPHVRVASGVTIE